MSTEEMPLPPRRADPRTLTTRYLYFRIHPRRMQACREADELEGRELMRYDRWLEA
jgi:hypothetical protein